MNTPMLADQQQLQYVQDFLTKIAEGDYSAKLHINNSNNEKCIEAQDGINILVEKLKTTTISRVFLNSIYNGINDILIVLNDKIEIQNTNQVVETLLFYTESELLNQSIGKLIQRTDIDLVRDAIRKTYTEKKLHEIAFNFITKDSNLIPVSCSFSPLYNAQGKLTGILLVAKNMSTLLDAKTQLQNKNDELNLFVYKASHDLKGPVSSMMGILALLNKSEDLQEMKMCTKMIDQSINKLDTIISDLLVLGQITYGELEYTQIDIKQVIDAILNSIEFVDEFKNISFNVVIDEQVQSIVTEKKLLHTILLNLIDNAIKYRQIRSEFSYVDIHVSNKDNGIEIKIEDNGIGIENSQQANIFKIFYRATFVSKGSGLGLYIAKTSVLKLGGTISFESVFGEGTCFNIYLPCKSNSEM